MKIFVLTPTLLLLFITSMSFVTSCGGSRVVQKNISDSVEVSPPKPSGPPLSTLLNRIRIESTVPPKRLDSDHTKWVVKVINNNDQCLSLYRHGVDCINMKSWRIRVKFTDTKTGEIVFSGLRHFVQSIGSYDELVVSSQGVGKGLITVDDLRHLEDREVEQLRLDLTIEE